MLQETFASMNILLPFSIFFISTILILCTFSVFYIDYVKQNNFRNELHIPSNASAEEGKPDTERHMPVKELSIIEVEEDSYYDNALEKALKQCLANQKCHCFDTAPMITDVEKSVSSPEVFLYAIVCISYKSMDT